MPSDALDALAELHEAQKDPATHLGRPEYLGRVKELETDRIGGGQCRTREQRGARVTRGKRRKPKPHHCCARPPRVGIRPMQRPRGNVMTWQCFKLFINFILDLF